MTGTDSGRGAGVAIIGMSCVFPQAPDVDAFWSNILSGLDAVSDPPQGSWDPDLYYDPSSNAPDRIYCKRGGFLGDLARFDPVANNTPPSAVGGEPDQWLALQAARNALNDAGYAELDEPTRRRTGIVLGRGATFNGGTAVSIQHSLVLSQTIEIIKSLHPEFSSEDLEALRQGLKQNLPPMQAETVPGLVPNVVVGRIANRLDLMGPSYTVDAACAASLVAVNLAVQDLVTGSCDLVLAGGSQIWTPVPMLSVFCQLGALSRSQTIRPFDARADGTILGEGLGLLVLKRLSDAERDGDRVYAVIRGVGVASDGRAIGVMAPRLEGEELAIRRAYEAAGVDPATVGLIEAHGTGTQLGDLTEFEALSRVFGGRTGKLPSVALGTVKSMISHTVQAAGVAGMIKTALALHHKVVPPTLNCEEPNPRLNLDDSRFYISSKARPWCNGEGHPRRAGVSSFGFGGVDAHVVLEEYPAVTGATGRSSPSAPGHRPAWESEVFILEAESRAGLASRAQELVEYLGAAPLGAFRMQDLAFTLAGRVGTLPAGRRLRLAVVAGSTSELLEKFKRAAEKLRDPACSQIKEREGVYFSAEPLGATGKVAFMFPGEGAQYPGMLSDLCLHFPPVQECFDQTDRLYLEAGRAYPPSSFIFPQPTFSPEQRQWAEDQLWDMDIAAAAVLTADEALLTLLEGLGVKPDVVVGHSSGEWAALRAAGVFGATPENRARWIGRELLDVYRQSIDQDRVPPSTLLALGAGRADVESLASEIGSGVRIAMDNCPHQVVVSVEPDSLDAVLSAARRRSWVIEKLPFDRPYHTPDFAPYSERLMETLAPLEVRPPQVPVYSCATAAPFPNQADAVKRTTAGQWSAEVNFRSTVEALYEDGARVFVEVGPRGNLTAFARDVLRGRGASLIPSNVQRRSGIGQLNHMAGLLAVQGVDLDLSFLFRWREPRELDLQVAPPAPVQAGMLLRTDFPAMRIPEELAADLRSRGALQPSVPSGYTSGIQPADIHPDAASKPAPPPEDIHSFLETMERFLGVQQRVMTAFLDGTDGRGAEPAPDEDLRS